MNDVKKILGKDEPTTENLAASMREDERKAIAKWVVASYDTDKRARKPWEDKRNRWYKLWLMEREPKNTPWPGCSNVCLPLIAVSCNQFHARSYQAMTAAPEVVQTLPTEPNDFGRAKRVRGFMNWQIQHDMEEWEEEHDKLCLGVPLNGVAFKKYQYDGTLERPVSEYVSAMNIILPYRTKNLRTARRVTHEIREHYDNLSMKNKKSKGYYVDFNKVSKEQGHDAGEAEIEKTKDGVETESTDSIERPKLWLETHCWYQRESDGMFEPYIFTVDYDSSTLVRATNRKMKVGDKEYVAQHFVDYHFIPNPEGYYSFGFGHFLEQLNEMGNTAFNQIFDAGRISNQPFGFYGRRLGMKKKELKLWPGRMEEVEDASQVYFPNMQRVDQVLFQVLGLIQNYSEQFTSTSDYLLGRESKGTKTPTATGTTAIIEQGLVLYTVMIKRLFRSFKKELGLIYTMDQLFLPEEKQYRVMGDMDFAFPKIKWVDFEGKLDVVPVGDPSYANRGIRRQEATEIMMGLINNPVIGLKNPQLQVQKPEALYAATKKWLETFDSFKDMSKLLPDLPEPPISPEAENALFMQGDSHDPAPGEDYLAHVKAHQQFKTSPYFQAMPKEYQALLDEHINKTLVLALMEQQTRSQLGGGQPGMPGQPTAGPVPGDQPPGPMPGAQQPPMGQPGMEPALAMNGAAGG